MRLTRTIPAKKQTIEVINFRLFGWPYKAYKEAIVPRGLKCPSSCYWCKSKFSDDSEIYTVIWPKKAEMFCAECVAPLKKTPNNKTSSSQPVETLKANSVNSEG